MPDDTKTELEDTAEILSRLRQGVDCGRFTHLIVVAGGPGAPQFFSTPGDSKMVLMLLGTFRAAELSILSTLKIVEPHADLRPVEPPEKGTK